MAWSLKTTAFKLLAWEQFVQAYQCLLYKSPQNVEVHGWFSLEFVRVILYQKNQVSKFLEGYKKCLPWSGWFSNSFESSNRYAEMFTKSEHELQFDGDFCTVSNHGFTTHQRGPSLSVLPPVRMGLELPQRWHDLSLDKAEGHHNSMESLQPFSSQ